MQPADGSRPTAFAAATLNLFAGAETYGAQGLRAETPDALRSAIRRGFDHDGPTIIEIPVGDLPSPWHLIHMPRVRG